VYLTQPSQPACKGYTYGTHRICGPSETLNAVHPVLDKLGITRLADITGLDRIGIPVCMAVRPNSKSLSVSQGKGVTLDLAKASTIMESIEAYHAENVTAEILNTSYRALISQNKVCNPYELNLHPRSIFHENLNVDWIEGWDWIQKEAVYVPYDLVSVSFLSGTLHLPLFKQSSNGLASGNHVLEAVSHGICEVVERDAALLWQISQDPSGKNARLIDLRTIESFVVQQLLEKLKKAGIKVYLWDQTSDVGIPSFGCLLVEGPTLRLIQPHGAFGGYGCHLSKEIAVIRAITEAAQARLTYIAGARDDIYRSAYINMGASNQFGKWQGLFAAAFPSVDYTNLPSLETDSFEGDVQVETSLLREAGFERLIVVDLTQTEIAVPVVRVIIPGAEYFYEKPPALFGQRAWARMLADLAGDPT
jgi:putative methanogenesis marker protein 1